MGEKALQKLFAEIDRIKSEIDARRPLLAETARSLRDYYRVGLTYASNAIEGNSLDLAETKVVIEDGLTIGGKPMRDHLEAIGHAEAYDRMVELAGAKQITEEDVRELHRLFYRRIDDKQAGNYRASQVFITGTEFKPPKAKDVPKLMARLFRELPAARRKMHSVTFASHLHLQLTTIHPFVDGNGRTARLAMNVALMQKGYPVIIIPPIRRGDYIRAQERENLRRVKKEADSFESFVAEIVRDAMWDYLRMIRD